MASHKQNLGVLRRIGSALISARARAIMSIGIVLGLGAVGTLAAWSDTSTATSGEFTTGTIDIKLGNTPPGTDTITLTSLTNTAIAPGNTVTAPLLVRNSGTVPFNYTISVLANNTTLAGLLDSSVYANTDCSGTAISTVSGLSPSKPFGGVNRPIPRNGTDQLCIRVTMPSTATAPATPATGTITYSLVATST
ncbi:MULTISPECIES: SipW-dependent-type signal peptide-containing protein [Nocardiaceae]|uniref:SipW-dependent-type signal peptide-containing protein n=1 Tax=Nocardiaceae TaxID=85025 RepID=UPI00037CD190|nr:MULTISPECIES: SipW-dependent-type signal peptide-containing protein [Rhodococcus]OZD61040.1 hypothetical protein CH263_19640 [Rhodococcus sp. 06-1059B-a]OZF05049.1 hypothetical protein CH300_13635 [Rhodococcus sp. 15-1154-1]OZF55080.1 hypothetical protein CH292_06175 [Rhodococcus sp. 14-2470-1a]